MDEDPLSEEHPEVRSAGRRARRAYRELLDARQEVNAALEAHGTTLVEGIDHPRTRKLCQQLGAHGADLYSWWAWTPLDWTCPGCGRDKPRIARPNRNGQLIGHLVEHHDHMTAALEEAFQNASGHREEVVATPDAERFAKRMAPGISAYEPVIVCEDCNNADAAGKKAAGADRQFSFAIQDIARFIEVSDNQSHQVDPDAAKAVWAEAEPAHRQRMQIIRQLAELAAGDAHWFRPVPADHEQRQMVGRARAECANPFGHDRLDMLPNALWRPARATRSQPDDAWRRKPRPTTQIPARAQIDTVARVSHAAPWGRVADTWSCPACGRQKTQCVRASTSKRSSNPFTFGVWSVRFADVSGDVLVCDCCHGDKVGLEKEAGVRKHGVVTLTQFQRVIRPRPYQRHEIAHEAVAEVIAELDDG